MLNAIADLKLQEIKKIQNQANKSVKQFTFHQTIASELLDGQHQLLINFYYDVTMTLKSWFSKNVIWTWI